MNLIKPFLARDVEESKLKFPPNGLAVLCKIDGSFGFIQNRKLYARSLKQHENIATTEYFSDSMFEGLRGELTLGDNPTKEGLCRDTSSALRTVEGNPDIYLNVFDYVTEETKHLPYIVRYSTGYKIAKDLEAKGYKVRIIPMKIVYNLEGYLKFRDSCLEEGYEGCIIRSLDLPHKEGRSSAVKPELWRYKPWSSAEIRVTNLVEEMQNLNVAKKNELGYTARSSHKENKVGKDTLGTIQGNLVTPLKDFKGNVIADVGTFITVSTGNLTAKDCKRIWDNPEEMLNKIVEFDYMSFGLKDNGRFNQFKRIRSEVDIS